MVNRIWREGRTLIGLALMLLIGTPTLKADMTLTAGEFVEAYLEERHEIFTKHKGARYHRKKGLGTPKKLSPPEQTRLNRYIPPSYFEDQEISPALSKQRNVQIKKYEIIDSQGPYVDVRWKKRKCRKIKKWISGCSITRYKVGSSNGKLYLIPGKTLGNLGIIAPFWELFDHLNNYEPLKSEEKDERVAEIRKNDAGQYPWLEHELSRFYSTVVREPLKSPTLIDQQIYCLLAGFQERKTSLVEMKARLGPYLTAELMTNPDLLPGKLRVLKQDNNFTNRLNPQQHRSESASLFRDILLQVNTMAGISEARSLEELNKIAGRHQLTSIFEEPELKRQYFFVGHLLEFNDSREFTSFSEEIPHFRKYFSVAARLKFVNGILTQNTMDASWAKSCENT